MQAILFITIALAWGLSWYAIRLQLGATPDAVSIFWRFAIAAGCMWLALLAGRQGRRARLRQHLWFAIMGLTLFSGNFLLFYAAEHDVPSGLVSVVFSMATVFNALNQWFFHGIRPGRRILLGGVLGSAGVVLLFADQIIASGESHYVRGVLLALAGTCSFSLGNLASRRATADGIGLPNAMARGMSWGTSILAVAVLVEGRGFMPHSSPAYLGGLAYLAVVASVIGFFAYLSLMARVGPARAAYVTVVAPVIALTVSALLEGYVWTPLAIIGVPLILSGNLVIFARVGQAVPPISGSEGRHEKP